MKAPQARLQDTLETLVDGASLADVVAALANICYEKADHLESNWQDSHAAKCQRWNGKKLEQVHSKLV